MTTTYAPPKPLPLDGVPDDYSLLGLRDETTDGPYKLMAPHGGALRWAQDGDTDTWRVLGWSHIHHMDSELAFNGLRLTELVGRGSEIVHRHALTCARVDGGDCDCNPGQTAHTSIVADGTPHAYNISIVRIAPVEPPSADVAAAIRAAAAEPENRWNGEGSIGPVHDAVREIHPDVTVGQVARVLNDIAGRLTAARTA